jgi:hypothetical protein
MLIQILTHTPIYVWAILAFLVSRGVIAMRDREVETRKLVIIPIVMLVLSLQDIGAKFGFTGISSAAWAVGAAGMALLVWRRGGVRVAAVSAPSSAAGRVRVRGSWMPLAMMMAVFCTKYAVSVTVAIQPHVRQDALLVATVCALFGVFNGYFLGRLARDLKCCLGLRDHAKTVAVVASAPRGF